MKLGRWIILALLALLGSFWLGHYHTQHSQQSVLMAQRLDTGLKTDLVQFTGHTDDSASHFPSPKASSSGAPFSQASHSEIRQSTAQQAWVLEFPQHWVKDGDCQVQGTLKTLLTQREDTVSGRLHWVWNGQNAAAQFTGQITNRTLQLEMVPPHIGGFSITFKGKLTPSGMIAGTTKAKSMCRFKDGPFTLTPLAQPQRSPNAKVIPLFQKPFDGEFLISNYFDHDEPKQFVDSNGYMTTWQGTQLALGQPGAGIDGHGGYDWGLPENTPLKAVADGVVTFAGEGRSFFCPPLQKETTGNYVYLLHTAPSGEQFETEYVHLSQVAVKEGDRVNAGDVIGLSGNTGCSTGPHLHFGVRRVIAETGKQVLVDPYGWTGPRRDPWSTSLSGHESIWLWQPGQAPVLYEYGR
ncbi:MAG: M23 family metallopeptidase [Merismopedia sp. SIO2A8]|nr:M23 family metallopeptidase [Symploca sp. SIO2B6]NET48609.1 M23 family metallopeptidase [Merismopedia sp. SIO2A8]